MIQIIFKWLRIKLLNLGRDPESLDVQQYIIDNLTEDELRGLAQSQYGKDAWTMSIDDLLEWYNLGI